MFRVSMGGPVGGGGQRTRMTDWRERYRPRYQSWHDAHPGAGYGPSVMVPMNPQPQIPGGQRPLDPKWQGAMDAAQGMRQPGMPGMPGNGWGRPGPTPAVPHQSAWLRAAQASPGLWSQPSPWAMPPYGAVPSGYRL